MAKTNNPAGKAKGLEASLIVAGTILVVLAVLLGSMIYIWQQSAYDIGQSESLQSISAGANQVLTNTSQVKNIPLQAGN